MKSATGSSTSSGKLSAIASRICRLASASSGPPANARSRASALGHCASLYHPPSGPRCRREPSDPPCDSSSSQMRDQPSMNDASAPWWRRQR